MTGTTGNTLYYLHADHLGSTSVTTDITGTVLARQSYYPYGGVRSSQGQLPTDITFTGQRADATGLMFYNARYYAPYLNRWLQPDTIVPEEGNPQALNRYSYVANNPLKYVDTSGHCWGFASGLRGTALYGATCNNIDMALTIVQHPEASAGQKVGAGAYLVAEATAHAALAVGTAGLACVAAGPGCVAAAEGTLGIGAVASADGDPTNEVNTAVQVTQQGLNVFAKASEYGIRTYNQLSNQLSGTGLRAHHIIEKRFADILGVNRGQMLSVALTPEEHQLFTNAWQNAIGYSNSNSAITTLNATKEQIWAAAQKIYANYPALLEAARLTIFGK